MHEVGQPFPCARFPHPPQQPCCCRCMHPRDCHGTATLIFTPSRQTPPSALQPDHGKGNGFGIEGRYVHAPASLRSKVKCIANRSSDQFLIVFCSIWVFSFIVILNHWANENGNIPGFGNHSFTTPTEFVKYVGMPTNGPLAINCSYFSISAISILLMMRTYIDLIIQ
jgi:hypothetical protein